MRILIISDEVWNDDIHGNNNISNWFTGCNEEFANIYCSPGLPHNQCCKTYFQITDMMMVKSIFSGVRAGVRLDYNDITFVDTPPKAAESLEAHKSLYLATKKIISEPVRSIRDIIWQLGRYDIDLLRELISNFSPDIIFTQRMGSVKLCRLERIIKNIADVPIVAFTGDDEYSLMQLNFSPIYWLRRFAVRGQLKRNIPLYSLYYTLSKRQADYYADKFKIPTKVLQKCGNFSPDKIHSNFTFPIRMVYAGKLYCNRWKTLRSIRLALSEINKNQTKIILEIYSMDKLSAKKYKAVHDGTNSFFLGETAPDSILKIYAQSDIALHVEAFDLRNKLLTRLSFSTKIIDCLSCGCATLAVCWKEHAGYEYLSSENAALCAGSPKELKEILQKLSDNPSIITEYSQKAYNCGIKNHQREKVQDEIISDFMSIVDRNN